EEPREKKSTGQVRGGASRAGQEEPRTAGGPGKDLANSRGGPERAGGGTGATQEGGRGFSRASSKGDRSNGATGAQGGRGQARAPDGSREERCRGRKAPSGIAREDAGGGSYPQCCSDRDSREATRGGQTAGPGHRRQGNRGSFRCQDPIAH